jgi:hypothetical protein
MIKRTIAVVVALLPASAGAVQGKSLSDRVFLEPKVEARVEIDRADLTLESSSAPSLGYEVDFVTESVSIFGWGPSQKAYDKCTAVFDHKTGALLVHAEPGLVARIRLWLPADHSVRVTIKDGKASIGARAGRTAVEMDNGLLSFDASLIPASSCVEAQVDSGLLMGGKSGSCADATAKLHLKDGLLRLL